MYGARVFSYRSLSTLIIDGCGARVLESCCFAVPVCRKSMIGHGRSLRSKGPPQENIHPHTYIHTYYTYYVQSHPDKRTTQTLFTETIDLYMCEILNMFMHGTCARRNFNLSSQPTVVIAVQYRFLRSCIENENENECVTEHTQDMAGPVK